MTKVKEKDQLIAGGIKMPPTPELEHIKKVVRKERLFDARWYAITYKLEFTSSEQAEEEFFTKGALARRNPNPLFSTEFYGTSQKLDQTLVPFFKYVAYGIDNDHSPHPLVDVAYVKTQLHSLNLPDSVLSALLHKCSAMRLSPHPAFSVSFYLQHYPELVAKRVHPIIHYLTHGVRELRAPHPLFWPKWVNRDNKTNQKIGLLEYISTPEAPGLSPNPYFDPEKYYARYPDVKAFGVNALTHYLKNGQFEKRIPNSAVDPDWVEAKYGIASRTVSLDPLAFLITHKNKFVTGNPDSLPLETVASVDEAPISTYVEDQFGTVVQPLSARRILYVSHNLRIQGAQTSLFELACGIHGRFGHQVIVYAPDHGPMRSRYQAEGIDVREYKLPVAGLADEKYYNKLLNSLQDDIAKYKPDVIHGNTIQSYHIIALAARLGIPSVWNIRESEDPSSHHSNLHPIASKLLDEAVQSSVTFAFVAKSTQELWRKSFPGIRSECIQNGIDFSRLQPHIKHLTRDVARSLWRLSSSDVALFNVGTWTERKGQIDIIRALPKVDRRLWPKLRVILIGSNESPYAAEVLREINDLPVALRDRIQTSPETKNERDRVAVLAAYKGADAFLFPSRIESYPRVVNEALYFGLPVISVPCFGAVEQIEDGKSGFFYEAGDAAALALHIENLVADPELRERMRHEALVRSRHHLMQYDEMLKRYDELYSAIHANKKSL